MIETERLILRPWRDNDVTPFIAAMNTPNVTRWLGGPRDFAHFADLAARMQTAQTTHGHCFWIVERRSDRDLLGFCGLRRTEHPGTPVHGKAELGWRLRESAWGQGYAKEAALASIAWGWINLPDDEQIAYTVAGNSASWGLMLRLDMAHRPDLDFDHPMFAPGHELCRHVTYAIARAV